LWSVFQFLPKSLNKARSATQPIDPESQIYFTLLEAVKENAVFDLGRGNDFEQRAAHFQATLKHLGKTITETTRRHIF
jgi:hypothetical protein